MTFELKNLVVFRDSGEVRSDALVEVAAGDAGLLEHGGHVRGGHVGPVLGGAQLVENKPNKIIVLEEMLVCVGKPLSSGSRWRRRGPWPRTEIIGIHRQCFFLKNFKRGKEIPI